MTSKTQIQFVKSLGQSKFRQKYDNFTAEGEKTVTEFLKSGAFPPLWVYSTRRELLEKVASHLPEKQKEVVSEKVMSMMSSFKTPSSLLAVFEKKENICLNEDILTGKSLYLDDIQDPGNLGTIIRIADWFGIKNIIRSTGSVDFFHPKAVQSSMGSLCNIKTRTDSLTFLSTSLPELPVLGALLEGETLNKSMAFPAQGILVIGNEGHGISQANLAAITKKIKIDGDPGRMAESLNAAMATSIICHYWVAKT